MDIPFRFGKGFDTKITLADGEWTDVKGGRLWSMGFRSNGANSINFVFDGLYLPDSARLYAANIDGTMLYGPVTSKQNTKTGYFLTDLIQGDEVILYLFEPDSEKGKSELTIKRVVHAYMNVMSYGNLGGSDSCNNNIACFPAWDEESDAVALVLLSNGTEWCSGSLLMTANQSFIPYFLSAFHCIDRYSPYGSLSSTEISDAENWMFKFQYKMNSCSGSTATTGVTFNGADFKAAWSASDFALMEMNSSPLTDTRFSWLGWDRSGTTPSSGTGIHHPSGDVMKISFDNNNLTSNSSQILWSNGVVSPINTHWVVGFDNGTTEGGSSGSPLFNQDKRVVGQLHGGQNGCAPVTKYYGQLDTSWTGGGTNTTRLSNWLDPCGSGAITTNTSRSPYISGPSNLCTSGSTYSVVNAPSGSYVSWSFSSNIQSYYGGNTWIALRAIGNGAGWVQATITNTNCGNITLPRMAVWAGIPTAYNFYTEVNGEEVEYYDVGLICPNTINCFDAESELDEMEVSDYTWHLPQGYTVWSDNGNGLCFDANGVVGSPIIGDVTNSCGTGYGVIQLYLGDNGCSRSYQYAISPNPASTELTVEQLTAEEAVGRSVLEPAEVYDLSDTKDADDGSYTVEIWPEKKGKVTAVTSKSKKEMIDVSKLEKGYYILHIRTKQALYQEHILVK